MISLSKITVSDKVSAWIQLVNNIVDTIKLAVAPSSFNEKGEPVGGIDGYLSSLDKKKIDELDITYMPIRGELPADATWYKANAVTDANSFYLTVESNNVILYDKDKDFEIRVIPAELDEYAIKYVCLMPNATNDYKCDIKLLDKNNLENLEVPIDKTYYVSSEENKGTPIVLRFIFICGKYFVYEEGKWELPEMKTVNGEVIFGEGDIDLVAPDELKTLNGESLVGNGNITTLQATDFKTIDGIDIVGEGDIDIVLPEELKTINGQSLIGEGDITTLQSSDLKTINGEIIVGEGDIVTLQSSDLKTINGESILGSGDLIIDSGLKESDFKTINGESIVGIGDIVTLQASDFKTINGESIIGTGNIIIQGGGEDPENKSRLGVARLGEMVLGVKKLQDNNMAYTKQTFTDYQVLTADNMNFIEDGIEQAHLGLEDKQNILVSGTNIKTINGISILGEGDLEIQNQSEPVMGYASEYIQISEEGVTSVTIPESVKNYSIIMVYHNGKLLVKDLHYTVEGDVITFVEFTSFKDDVFTFVGFGIVS